MKLDLVATIEVSLHYCSVEDIKRRAKAPWDINSFSGCGAFMLGAYLGAFLARSW